MIKRLATAFLIGAAMLLASCGGGGGSASGSAGTASGSTATVGVLVTDAPVGKWDQAIATITDVTLIGEAGQVTLFSGSKTLDLLKLADFSELFAVSNRVPAGSYSKIRLHLSNLVLNDLDANGTVVESVHPQLVGNGKIDLNPRGPFTLRGGDVIFIELDFDMDKSLKITGTGNGRIILRPVVFVNIRTAQLDGRLARIHGQITDINATDFSLRLCQSDFASGEPVVQPLSAGARGSSRDHGDNDHDFGPGHCVTVRTDGATGIFDTDGQPQDFTGLAVGEEATVIGRLRPLDTTPAPTGAHDDDFGHDQSLAFDAVIIEEGPLGTYRRIAGTANSAVDGSAKFGLDIAAGQGFGSGSSLTVQLFENSSRVFNRQGRELQFSAIQAGKSALADGVLHLGNLGEANILYSPLLILDAGPAPGAAQLEGKIVSVDTVVHSLVVNDGTANRCVDASLAQVFEVSTAGGGFSSTRVDLGDLKSGQAVSIFGNEQLGGCLEADTIIAESI
jgi:hypothetical protein